MLDKDFYKYASNPDNIIIDIRMECDIIVNYDAKLTIDYKEKEFNTRVKGINAEVRSNKIYLTADKTIDSNWEKKSKDFKLSLEKFFNYKDGYMNEINKKDINTSNVIHLDASKDLNTITKCFNLCKTNEYALQSLVNKEITNKTHYWKEERQLEKQIGTDSTFKDFSFTKFELLSSPFKNEDDFAFIFHRLYKIGVNYDGKEYMTEYKNKYFGPFYKLEVKYSKEAIDEGNKKS